MRLLVPTRISLALRRVTSSPVSAAAAQKTHAPTRRSKAAAPAAASPTTPQLLQLQVQLQQLQLQKLWKLSKASSEGERKDPVSMKILDEVTNSGELKLGETWLLTIIHSLNNNNDFAKIEKLLEAFDRSAEKAPNVLLVSEVLWAAVRAKSLGALPPSIFNWIEGAVSRLPEPSPAKKESMIWMLSILRGDLRMLQQLQNESCSKNGKVGPGLEREKTLRYAALAYLQMGKKDEFRSLWLSSGSPLLGEYDQPMQQQSAAFLHHSMLQSAGNKNSHPSMLRWYAESLASHQRTPIGDDPHFKTMMEPVIGTLGGKIEKWREHDRRMEKLRKWRDDYDDVELDKLLKSLLDYFRHRVAVDKHGSTEDLRRLEKMLSRLSGGENRGTVVIDWLNFSSTLDGQSKKLNMINVLPLHPLVVVGRQRWGADPSTPLSPDENKRIKVMEVTSKREKTQEMDDVCSMILAVATRGHLLSNDKTRPHIAHFSKYLQDASKDVGQSILLKNYLNDAALRHDFNYGIQRVVDQSKAAQWIHKEKKELAFTVARRPNQYPKENVFRWIDYYSLHID